jgi:leucine dehydrogenase
MAVFDHAEYDDHESLHFFHDASTGLQVIIAVHSTVLGPGAGGCRRWTYASDADALTDALRLSRGMTYKNAVAELPFGGAKAVILASESAPKSAALFAAYGRAVDSLAGHYITAEDVGVSVDDMRHVQSQTRFVSGLPQSGDDAGGDPSPWTAVGVFLGLQAAVKSRLGRDSLDGLKIAVQGVGHVGAHLCKLLHDAGAVLFVADVNNDHLTALCDAVPAEIVHPADILFTDVDVLAPCALGNIFTSATISNISAKVIAGAANNQLATAADGARLAARDILYAPDYVINAGGIISVSHEYRGQSSAAAVQIDIEKIPQRLHALFESAAASGRPTNELADELARKRIAAAHEPDRTDE